MYNKQVQCKNDLRNQDNIHESKWRKMNGPPCQNATREFPTEPHLHSAVGSVACLAMLRLSCDRREKLLPASIGRISAELCLQPLSCRKGQFLRPPAVAASPDGANSRVTAVLCCAARRSCIKRATHISPPACAASCGALGNMSRILLGPALLAYLGEGGRMPQTYCRCWVSKTCRKVSSVK